jgi:putative hydrolase of the HAD superfamily
MSAPAPIDFSDVDTWVFDLDNTLYPPESELFALIDARMTAYIMRELAIDAIEAHRIQKLYYHAHGTTLAGLMAQHGVDPHHFLDEVHDIALDRITPDPDLISALEQLPGRVYIFTNGSVGHATRVCERLGILHCMHGMFDIIATDFIPKPDPKAFEAMVQHFGFDPARAAMFEDLAKNLKPAATLGMTTVLVGPHAADDTSDFVHHRTRHLSPFLMSLGATHV